MHTIEMSSILTCPKCGHVESVEMPAGERQQFYACKKCHLVIMPKPGSCCVFCSYGSNPCPTAQKDPSWDGSRVFTISLAKRMRI